MIQPFFKYPWWRHSAVVFACKIWSVKSSLQCFHLFFLLAHRQFMSAAQNSTNTMLSWLILWFWKFTACDTQDHCALHWYKFGSIIVPVHSTLPYSVVKLFPILGTAFIFSKGRLVCVCLNESCLGFPWTNT